MFKISSNEITPTELIHGGSRSWVEIHRASWQGKEVVVKEHKRREFYDYELKIYSTVEHPNLMKLQGIIEGRPNPCLVFDYMAEGNLKNYIQKLNQHWDSNSRLTMALGIALGLEYLHSKNILHLDLKTANILIDSDHTPKIIDFETSVQLPDGENEFINETWERGTENWAAPETENGHPTKYTKACDIYSFSLILWVMYSFLEIDNTANIWKLSATHINEATVAKLCFKGWSKNPSKRPDINKFVKVFQNLHQRSDDTEDSDSSEDSDRSFRSAYRRTK